jgi:hypothetical protein
MLNVAEAPVLAAAPLTDTVEVMLLGCVGSLTVTD